MKTARTVVFALIFLSFVLSASAQTVKGINDGPGPGPDGPHGPNGPPNYSVAEPASILLLGAGLVSLGVYAKRKRGKKQ